MSSDRPLIRVDAGTQALLSSILRAPETEKRQTDVFLYRAFGDGSEHLRWIGLFDFLLSPAADTITGWHAAGLGDTFAQYLLGTPIAMALVRRGIEPFHAAAVVVPEGVAAILGDCGQGKSTLSAAFVNAGHRLLTDDVLVTESGEEGVLAQEGPQRIKLFPEAAEAFLPGHGPGVLWHPSSEKRVFQLDPAQCHHGPAPLKAIYLLDHEMANRPAKRVDIRGLSPRDATMALVANTFSTLIRTEDRLKRQLVAASGLARSVPVRRVSFPLGFEHLTAVVDAIRSDLCTLEA